MKAEEIEEIINNIGEYWTIYQTEEIRRSFNCKINAEDFYIALNIAYYYIKKVRS